MNNIMNKLFYVYTEIAYTCKEKVLTYKKQFFILLSIYLFAFSAIIRANYSYVDDMGRAYAGYHGWLDWSRWTTEILATLVHAEWHLTDISPLPQILACIIMAVGGIILLDIFKKDCQVGLWHVAAAALTGLAPFFLGIVVYKFDSPYMALSFLASVFPFLFYKKSKKVYIITSIFGLLIMCTTYQASSGIYPLIVLFGVMEEFKSGVSIKKILKFIGISVSCYFVSLSIFWFALMRPNGVSVASPGMLISYVVSRYIAYYKIICYDFTPLWLLLILAIAVLFIYLVCKTASIPKIFAFFLGILTVLIGSALCFGAYLFISEEAYDTRCMYGFNLFLTLMAIYISYHTKYWIPKAIYTALAWCFFVFSLTYGNALALQQDYLNYRITLVANDLNSLEFMKTDDMKKIRIEGAIGLAPAIKNMSETYPFLKKEIFSGFGSGFWGGYYFYHYFNIPNIEVITDEDGCQYQNLPLINDTMYHTISGDGHYILIELK